MKRNIIVTIALLVLLIIGIKVGYYAYDNGMKSYDGSDTDVVALYNDPEDYELSDIDGIANIIVKEDLSKTQAVNNVAAVVFDYRGFDTLGESFILLTAIAGSFVILAKRHKKKKEEADV